MKKPGRPPVPKKPARERCPTCDQTLPRADLGPWGKARKKAGISCRDAAAATGLSASTINRADYDGEALSLNGAARLAKCYGVPLESMIEKAGPT